MTTSSEPIGLTTTSAAALESAEITPPAALIRQQGVPRVLSAGRRSRTAGHHTGDEFSAGLKLAAQKLSVRTVGDPQSQVDRLQLFVDIEPDAAARLNRRQRG